MESALEKALKDFRNKIGQGEKPAVLTNILAGKKWNANLPRFGGVDGRMQQNRKVASPIPQKQEVTPSQEITNPFVQAIGELLRTPDRNPGMNHGQRVQGAHTTRNQQPLQQARQRVQQAIQPAPQEKNILEKILGAITPEPTRFDYSEKFNQTLKMTPEEQKAVETIRIAKPDYKGSDEEIINLYRKHGQRLLQGLAGGSVDTGIKLPKPIEQGSTRIQPYVPFIIREAQRHKIDPRLLAGALARESMHFRDQYVQGYHQDGTGRGIAGIDKKWNPQITDEQAMNPEFAISWMANQLANLREAEGGDIYSALRRYNGGPAYSRQDIGFDGRTTIDQLTKNHANAILQHAANYGGYFQ